MKKAKYIALSFVALLLAGCAADDVLSSQQETEKAVVFNASADATRGTLVDETAFKNEGFYIYANTVKDGIVTQFMDNVKVSFADGSWKYAPVVYWPNDGSTVDFYPVYNDDNATCLYRYDKRPHITYIVPDNVADQTDFLWAAPVLSSAYSSGNVTFSFKHALAGINVEVTNVSPSNELISALKNSTAFAENPNGTIFDNYFKYDSSSSNSDEAIDYSTSDISSFTLESVDIIGKFPRKAEIDPNATSLDKAWLFSYDSNPLPDVTYSLTSDMLETDTDGSFKYKNKSDSEIFVLPCGVTNVTIRMTFSFTLKRGTLSANKFRFTLSNSSPIVETFIPEKKVTLKITPDFTKAPATIKKI